ncbi:hypothetical protein D210916BOD24_33250 [Alteromonas sp. D210916BOD_24]|uniref:substrate-binding domain-containing protein n=1 Tax=Alteromonas sp. D210916BOD_24 TaxID=3157618 RepID=UPI00399D2638
MKKPALRWLRTVLSPTFWGRALPLFVSLLSGTHGYAQELNVMVNESVMINELNRSELRQIFTGHRQYWSDGSKITVFVLNDNHELHKQFCRDVLQMFPYQLSRLWDQITYSGQGVTPIRVDSNQALAEALINTEGAIGYLQSAETPRLRRVEVGEL